MSRNKVQPANKLKVTNSVRFLIDTPHAMDVGVGSGKDGAQLCKSTKSSSTKCSPSGNKIEARDKKKCRVTRSGTGYCDREYPAIDREGSKNVDDTDVDAYNDVNETIEKDDDDDNDVVDDADADAEDADADADADENDGDDIDGTSGYMMFEETAAETLDTDSPALKGVRPGRSSRKRSAATAFSEKDEDDDDADAAAGNMDDGDDAEASSTNKKSAGNHPDTSCLGGEFDDGGTKTCASGATGGRRRKRTYALPHLQISSHACTCGTNALCCKQCHVAVCAVHTVNIIAPRMGAPDFALHKNCLETFVFTTLEMS